MVRTISHTEAARLLRRVDKTTGQQTFERCKAEALRRPDTALAVFLREGHLLLRVAAGRVTFSHYVEAACA